MALFLTYSWIIYSILKDDKLSNLLVSKKDNICNSGGHSMKLGSNDIKKCFMYVLISFLEIFIEKEKLEKEKV